MPFVSDCRISSERGSLVYLSQTLSCNDAGAIDFIEQRKRASDEIGYFSQKPPRNPLNSFPPETIMGTLGFQYLSGEKPYNGIPSIQEDFLAFAIPLWAILLLVQVATAGLVVAEHPKQRLRAILIAGAAATVLTALTYPLLRYLTTGHLPLDELNAPMRSAWVAATLGPAIATVIQIKSCAEGTPSTARNAPT